MPRRKTGDANGGQKSPGPKKSAKVNKITKFKNPPRVLSCIFGLCTRILFCVKCGCRKKQFLRIL